MNDGDYKIVLRFAELFRGNDRAFGTEDGGCERGDPDLTTAGRWNDYLLRIEDHLTGNAPMGVYPMVQSTDPLSIYNTGWYVHWGAIDFDEGEEASWVHARNCQLLLDELDVSSYIERSRSKGFHVWVFASTWVPAQLMRRALLAACQVVDAPTREINPKQETLDDGKLGNYVRLPYPGALSGGGVTADLRRMVVDENRNGVNLTEWLCGVEETTVETLQRVAALYSPPLRRRREFKASDYDGEAADRLSPYLRKVFEEGPLGDDPDRSAALYRFACLLAESGRIDEETAVELVSAYDEKHLQKFSVRSDGERRIMELVDRAYG